MIHPIVQELFDDESNCVKLFSWICKKSENVDEIEEFIKWHLDANKQVIYEILKIKEIDLSNSGNIKNEQMNF